MVHAMFVGLREVQDLADSNKGGLTTQYVVDAVTCYCSSEVLPATLRWRDPRVVVYACYTHGSVDHFQ